MLLMPSSFTGSPSESTRLVPLTESCPCRSTGVGPVLVFPLLPPEPVAPLPVAPVAPLPVAPEPVAPLPVAAVAPLPVAPLPSFPLPLFPVPPEPARLPVPPLPESAPPSPFGAFGSTHSPSSQTRPSSQRSSLLHSQPSLPLSQSSPPRRRRDSSPQPPSAESSPATINHPTNSRFLTLT